MASLKLIKHLLFSLLLVINFATITLATQEVYSVRRSGIFFDDATYPSGEIIDGWQRIVGSFVVSEGAMGLGISLNADLDLPTYYDDIRIHPFNGSMKSYVYDGETFWLTSELDDNNYATFYEYDNEGGLIRIKKETASGIVTIQETRSNTTKTDD